MKSKSISESMQDADSCVMQYLPNKKNEQKMSLFKKTSNYL